jgi:hypothetical protein
VKQTELRVVEIGNGYLATSGTPRQLALSVPNSLEIAVEHVETFFALGAEKMLPIAGLNPPWRSTSGRNLQSVSYFAIDDPLRVAELWYDMRPAQESAGSFAESARTSRSSTGFDLG